MKPTDKVESEGGDVFPSSGAASEIDLRQNRDDQAVSARYQTKLSELERKPSHHSGRELHRTVGENNLNRRMESLGIGCSRMSSDNHASSQNTPEGRTVNRNSMGPKGSRISLGNHGSSQNTPEGSMVNRNAKGPRGSRVSFNNHGSSQNTPEGSMNNRNTW